MKMLSLLVSCYFLMGILLLSNAEAQNIDGEDLEQLQEQLQGKYPWEGIYLTYVPLSDMTQVLDVEGIVPRIVKKFSQGKYAEGLDKLQCFLTGGDKGKLLLLHIDLINWRAGFIKNGETQGVVTVKGSWDEDDVSQIAFWWDLYFNNNKKLLELRQAIQSRTISVEDAWKGVKESQEDPLILPVKSDLVSTDFWFLTRVKRDELTELKTKNELAYEEILAFKQGYEGEGPPKIQIVTKEPKSKFWQAVMAGGRTAGEELGVRVELLVEAPTFDMVEFVHNATTPMKGGFDAIVLASGVDDALVPDIEKAVEKAGIPMIIMDSVASTASTEKYNVSFLAPDEFEIGATAADKMIKAMAAKAGIAEGQVEGQVAGITFKSDLYEKRKKGFVDRMKAYSGIEVVDFQDARGEQKDIRTIIQTLFATYPNLKGIYASDQFTSGEIIRFLDDTAGEKGVTTVVVDADLQAAVRGLKNGDVDFMIVQQPWEMGYMSVEYALRALKGDEFGKFIDPGVVAITPDMFASGEAKKFLDPVNYGIR